MYTITVEDEFGTVLNNFQYSSLNEAKRIAKDSAKHEQGRAVVSDEEDAVVIEFKYEDGRVVGYDDLGNAVSNV